MSFYALLRKRIIWNLAVVLLAGFAIMASGCGDSGEGNDDNVHTCTPGTAGCECLADHSCTGDLVCGTDGICKTKTCNVGDEGCACYANNTCNTSDSGEKLVCKDGICVVQDCPVGTTGCACTEGGGCDPGLVCETNENGEKRCVVPECPDGEEGCACNSDGTCNTGLICGDDNKCHELGCTPGTIGCICDDGECLADNAYCDEDNTCQIEQCPKGAEGCACADGDRCGLNSRGEQLVCESGICKAPSCTPGDTGCVCANGTDCTLSTDECVEGFCQPKTCVPGELNCECAGGSCNDGLTCRDGSICVDNTGYRGGPCFDNGTCRRGNRCQNDMCVPCMLGTLGCACNDAGECNPGLECASDICVEEGSLGPKPPEEPECYTPCESDLVLDDGTYVECPADKLMPGCLDGMECVDGSCVPSGSQSEGVACESDLDCPEFQTCIRGKCYSNCNINDDCPTGYACYKHVCRLPCSTNGETSTNSTQCPDGYSCVSNDGEYGFCMPVGEPTGEEQKSVTGSFSINKSHLDFTNVNTEERIVITNNGPTFERFKIRKLSETLYMADGTMVTHTDEYDDGEECNPASDCPLVWIEMGDDDSTSRVQEFEIGIEGNGGTGAIVLKGAGGASAPRWDGKFEVIHPRYGTQIIYATYSEKPEGRWVGNIYYFAQFGDRKLDEWSESPETRDDVTKLMQVGNAFVQRWGAFRSGNISWDEMQAVLTSTNTESWRWPSIKRDCPVEGGACYPYDINELGLVVYTSNLQSTPIPTGVTELPIAMNLMVDSNDPAHMFGRIESRKALQYMGNPAVDLRFGADPSGCERNVGSACLVFIDDFSADIYVGGRYETTSMDTNCGMYADGSYNLVRIPWLVPGFERATEVDDATGLRYRYECRDTLLPYNDGSDPLPQYMVDANISLAAANPIPNAHTLKRSLRIIDGALINQSIMFILFEERFDSFIPNRSEPFKAYGYMVLKRQATDLDDADENGNEIPDVYEGSHVSDDRTPPDSDDVLHISCDPDTIEEILGYGHRDVTSSNASDVVVGLIDGIIPSNSSDNIIGPSSNEEVHYLCVANGLFDGGPGAVTSIFVPAPNNDTCGFDSASDNFYDNNGKCDDGGPGSDTSICPLGTDFTDCGFRLLADGDHKEACPAGSEVIFFTVDKSKKSQEDIANEPCQQDGTCESTLNQWMTSGDVLIQYKPTWRCEDPNKVYCSEDRYDLRKGKLFYKYTEPNKAFEPLYAAINSAFRYKTQFRNREGKNIGFAPEICIPHSNQIPYCYSPEEIEEARSRIDCLLDIWKNYYDNLDAQAKQKLNDYLCTNFSYTEACHQGMDQTIIHDGFERLYAELLVMMGDEAYTNAFASRFDLSGSSGASFEGTLFERGGINLSGAAGYEMYNLYKAVEYYQEALDRFYSLSGLMWQAIGYGDHDFNGRNFVIPETVTWYFDRLIRASTQKARALSQIAKRYQNFNRADLARSVVERAYTSTYVESIVLSRLMFDIIDILRPEDRAQVTQVLEQGQKRYRMAMLDMRKMYESITSEINYFGFPPDYIPFPTLGQREQNAFEVILQRARNKLEIAKERENSALSQNRSFETDAAEFQAELIRLRNTYESQIADLCGSFEGSDGKIYPAIARYAYLNEKASKFQDPCGLMGTGAIHEAMGQFEVSQLNMKQILTHYNNILKEIEIERSRVSAQCNRIVSLADYEYMQEGRIISLEDGIKMERFIMNRLERLIGITGTLAGLQKCTVGMATDCPSSIVSVGMYLAVTIGADIDISAAEVAIGMMEHEISTIRRDMAKWRTLNECVAAQIDSNARVATLLLQLKEAELEALKAEYQVRLGMSQIQQMYNKAKRLEQELEEAEEYTINIQAAKNDPNVRIYRNDAYLNADISFEDALREVYRATKVFEYYTSQSYADLDKLFLVRMVQYGDYNLENYLTDLENAFYEFEETYGLPDTRVAIVSLRDDIFHIPRIGDDGSALSQNTRIQMMREKLTDPQLLDENGYITIPFSTTFTELSPLTRNHKILYIEAEFIGSDVGDTLGRVYLRQEGTSVIRGVDGIKIFYRFPERTAVINPFFNGNRVFSPEVYRNGRLRDRPYVNTAWELIINQRDELVNKDINLNGLSDIRLYIYYTDFTGI